MTIVEHLEELRKRLLYSLAAFGVATSAGYLFVERILAVVLRPVGQVVFLAPTEAFFVRLKVAALAGVFLSLPVTLYQLWRFVSVGLTPTERRYSLSLVPAALALFVSGAAFAGNLIPATRFDPTALNILNKYIPLANQPNNILQGHRLASA